MCDICNIYYSHKPCPNCQPNQKISNQFTSEKINSKSFLIAPTINELDFIWAQVTRKTIQRVQNGGQVLRQGFFNADFSEKDINFEWIGSSFNQGFYSRLERLYPGTTSIVIVCDVISQNFSIDLLTDLLNDLINVNKRNLKNFYLTWLEPYSNSSDQYEDYKLSIKAELLNYISSKGLTLEIKTVTLPLYSTVRFTEQIKNLLSVLINVDGFNNFLDNLLPLRPLFRTQQPILDPKAPNRVVILDLEKTSSIEPIKYVNLDLNETVVSNKCLACSSEIKFNFKVCLTCKFTFCERCIAFLLKEGINEQEFCLGSIYHGLHRSTFIS